MRKIIPILVLICLALIIVSCAPGEVGPGKAIAGVGQAPEFNKLVQCTDQWKHHKYVFFDVNNCREGSTSFDHFPIVGYTLKKPLHGYDMNALTICESHKQRRTEPYAYRTSEQDYSEFMIYAANKFGCPPGFDMRQKAGYTFNRQIPGSRAVYQLYRDAWEKNHWGHILYTSTDYKFGWKDEKVEYYSYPGGKDYTGLVGYFLMAPQMPVADEPTWVPLYQCYHEQGGESGRQDFFYTPDPNCLGGKQIGSRFAYISTTPFQGSVLLSECAREKVTEKRHPITKKRDRREYEDRYVVQGKSCPEGKFSHEIGYAYANQEPGTSALYRCWADHWNENVWDHWLSFNPNCPSTRTKDTKQEEIYGWVPRTLPLPAQPPVQIARPPAKPVPQQPGYECTGKEIDLRLNREAEDYRVRSLEDEFKIKLVYA
ncbi:hypothetical protein GF343_04750, partial [Candidatus Woesearchaeota archaeon]|nr:hypothetical protein [Candidatus Woesearchaeota archaeon]